MAPHISISATDFHQTLERFRRYLKGKGDDFRDFQTGLMYLWESRYKAAVRDEAIKRLELSAWKNFDLGKGEILRRVIDAVEINISKDCRNNLVEWEPRFGLEKRHHNSLYEHGSGRQTTRYEALLHDFFCGELTPEESMSELIALAGNHYDFISYLYFLKDWELFAVVRPKTFEKSFDLMGVRWNGEPPKLGGQCSWLNYQAFNSTLLAVRELLLESGIPNVRLIDAHSFCWTIAKAEMPKVEPKAAPPVSLLSISPNDPPEEIARKSGGNRNIDFNALAQRRALLGRLAEERALQAERARLSLAGSASLSDQVRLVSDDHTLGYDISSFELDGTPRLIEVKAASFNQDHVSFYITQNEFRTSHSEGNYWVYLVKNPTSENCAVYAIPPGILAERHLTPVTYQAHVPTVSSLV